MEDAKTDNQASGDNESPVEFRPFLHALLGVLHLAPVLVFILHDCSANRSPVSYGINGDPDARIVPKLIYSRIQLLEDSTTNVAAPTNMRLTTY